MQASSTIIGQMLAAAVLSSAHADQTDRTITSPGYAEIKVVPDSATVDVGVVTSNPVTTAALRANSAEMQRVVAAIRATGVSEADVQTTNFSIAALHPKDKDGRADETRVNSYRVNNTVTVTVNDLRNVGKIIDAAVDAGANSSNSVSFSVKDHAALDDRALTEAIRDARHSAGIMAAAEGVRLGRMISAQKEMSYGAVQLEAGNAVAEGDVEIPFSSGQVSVTANVKVVFAIEQ